MQEQPYIIIVGRDTVEHLSWEAKRYKANRESFYKSGKGNDAGDELLDVQFQPDADYDKMPGIGGKTEIVESEMGISTQKLHARGPMGLRELTTYKYIVTGDGQTR